MAEQAHSKLYVFLICLALIVGTFIAYEPMRHNDFVEYDDSVYITENPDVRGPITLDSVIRAFIRPHAHMWHPLTTLSHMLDCRLFGLNPSRHHFVSLLFHIANSLLLFWILADTTGAIWASAFAAAVFALHPLGVESVAWAAERKTVLSGFFWFLTIAAYIWYTKRPGIGRYILSLVVYALCIMTKPTVVPLPLVLLLLDYWPLGRFQPEHISKTTPHRIPWQIFYRLVREKIIFFILSAVLCVITFFAQRGSVAMAPIEELSAASRIANAFISYIRYIGKIFWPEGLAVLYPHPYGTIPIRQVVISVLLLLAVSICVIRLAQKHRYLTTGWLWYLVTLVPVIGIVQVGLQAMADRYTYLPAIGIFIMAAWGAAEIGAKLRLGKMRLGIPAGLVLIVLLICTRMQVRHWQDTSTLYKRAALATKNNFTMHTLYGNVLCEKMEFDEAIKHFKEALRINPRYSDAYNGLGMVYEGLGKDDLAFANFTKGIELNPGSMDNLNNLAWLLATGDNVSAKDAGKAIELAENACRLTEYKNPQCLDTLAAAYASAGKFSDAVNAAEAAVKLAKANGWEAVAVEIQSRIKLFQSGQPYRR